jgi:hypothetical protein
MDNRRMIGSICGGILLAGVLVILAGCTTTVTIECDSRMGGDQSSDESKTHGWCRSTGNSGTIQADNGGQCSGGMRCLNPGTTCIGGGGTCHNYKLPNGICSCQCY